jgi:hypothetical protein
MSTCENICYCSAKQFSTDFGLDFNGKDAIDLESIFKNLLISFGTINGDGKPQ